MPIHRVRLPELSAGDFMSMMQQLCRQCAARLYTKLPGAVRALCLRAFEAGRAHLLFVFTLKLCYFGEPPALLFVDAHFHRAKAIRALRVCLAPDCPHPRTQALERNPLAMTTSLFIEVGVPDDDLPEFMVLIGGLRFVFSSEVRVGQDTRVSVAEGGLQEPALNHMTALL